MSKYIGEGINLYDSTIYIDSFDGNDVSFSTDCINAILISESDKKAIKKIVKSKCLPDFKFIKLEKFNFITNTTYHFLEDYDKTPIFDLAKLISGQDSVNVECMATALTDLEGIDTFKQFGEIVANKVIAKNNLQKKQ